jgi:hypothetical protein
MTTPPPTERIAKIKESLSSMLDCYAEDAPEMRVDIRFTRAEVTSLIAALERLQEAEQDKARIEWLENFYLCVRADGRKFEHMAFSAQRSIRDQLDERIRAEKTLLKGSRP